MLTLGRIIYGTTRKWQNNNYALSYDNNNGYWCIHNANQTVNYYDSYFRAKNLNSSETGDSANPYIYDHFTDGLDIEQFGVCESTYMYINLKEGITYKIGYKSNVQIGDYYYPYINLYDITGDNYYGYGNYDTKENIDGDECTNVMTFTPSSSGIYRISLSAERSGVTGTIQVKCYPTPEAWPEISENPWEDGYTFTSYMGSGNPVLSGDVISGTPATKTWEGYQAFKNTDNNGNTYFTFASTLTKDLKWNQLTPNPGEVFSEDASIKAAILTTNEIYPSNASIWKIDITSANTNHYIWVAGGAGNIIDWGDGAQTTTNYADDTWSGAQLNTAGVYKHTYTTAGTYLIKVIGDSVFHIITHCGSSRIY